MLTPEVEKYLDKQFEQELDAKDIVKDLISGGWRDSDAETVVRQYETKHTLAGAPPMPPSDTSTVPNKNKIDFSKVGSHDDQSEDVEIGKDFVPKKEAEDVVDEVIEKTEKEEKELIEEKREAREDSLISARVDENASYEEFMPTFEVEDTPADHRELHRNSKERNPDPYEAPEVTFNPLDIKPQKEPAPEPMKKKKVSTPARQKTTRKPGRKKVLLLLVFVWLLIIGVIGGLYYLFIYQPQLNLEPEQASKETTSSPSATVLSVRNTPLNQSEQTQETLTSATCDNNLSCFVSNGKTCNQIVSVEKTRETTFFSSKKNVRSYLELGPGPEGRCLFQSEIISVQTEFTADIAQETVNSVRLNDQKAVGLTGKCLISKFEIARFLDRLQENTLTDLDYLSLGCTGGIHEQNDVKF